MLATGWGMPVSTTQTVVGALIGVGFASGASVKWRWESGSVSQVAASWAIAPLIAAAFSALIFGVLKYAVLERSDPFKWAMRLIPFYFAFTGAVLALFIVVEAPTAPSLEEFGIGKGVGIILGVFVGCLLICYVFFVPFFKRKLIMKDTRVRIYHVILGPMLLKENVSLFWPGKGDEYVTNYYEDAYGEVRAERKDTISHAQPKGDDLDKVGTPPDSSKDGVLPLDPENSAQGSSSVAAPRVRKKPEPYERFIGPVSHLSWVNPRKWYGYFKFGLLQGMWEHCLKTLSC
jgi:PiT family inorganic phosphate transporter